MTEASKQSTSRLSLSSVLIAVATLALVAAILLPPYLRGVLAERRSAAFAAQAQPTLDALIEAERAYKEQKGKFWRDAHETLSPEATKQTLGVDLGGAPDCSFAIYPPDLEADPTLRIAAKASREGAGMAIECVYDSIAHTKSCKRL
jgi:Tfp pilus assembly protein PilE